jgi:glyceraldehyde 3-phosphate dehydrogenase
MNIKVGINGFGRIGRLVARSALGNPELQIVAVHDLAAPKTMAHLLKHDTVHGPLARLVNYDDGNIVLRRFDTEPADEWQRIKVIGGKTTPCQIDWGGGVDVVVEATGIFRGKAGNGKDGYDGHLGRNGCKKVILTVPPKGDIDATIVLGVNDDSLEAEHHCVSNASCTTNCLAPIAKVLNDRFGIVRGYMNTVHAYTNDQVVSDQIHEDLRRARAAAANIIPTSTGAASAIGKVIPGLAGKLQGDAMRVPVLDGSAVILVVETKEQVAVDWVNEAMRVAAEGPMKGILGYCDEEIVSSDILRDPRSSIYDSRQTILVGPHMVKVMAWYDNEWAYSCRVVDLIMLMAARGFLG